VNQEQLQQQATAWEPTGWTPISLALQNAGEDFPTGENVRNVIIMVTDGEETCDGDPCAVAEALAASGAEVLAILSARGARKNISAPSADRPHLISDSIERPERSDYEYTGSMSYGVSWQ